MSNTTFQTIREKTSALKAQIATLQAEAAEQIKPLLQQFLADHPQVEAVQWHQYTPYFNDGDECVFRLGEIGFKFVGDDEEAGDYEDGFHEGFHNASPDGTTRGYSYRDSFDETGPSFAVCSRETEAACRALSSELSGMEDELKVLFGDHVEITVTKDGVDVSEYDHD